MWEIKFQNAPWKYTIISNNYVVDITGGSVKIFNKAHNEMKIFKGYKYLYTGNIKPDESEFFALENGKHFFVYSLKRMELIKRVTLPRMYKSIDCCGYYSENGKYLYIPANRYVYTNKKKGLGYYEEVLCKYDTRDYSFVDMIPLDNLDKYHWRNFT